MFNLKLRAGDVVEIRSAQEIIDTLDENGALDGLPFMPEMLRFCGQRARVWKSAHKTCDTIECTGSRWMEDAVHLEGLRCDGSAHGGCQAMCLLFWKGGWLRRISPADGESTSSSGGEHAGDRSHYARLLAATRQPSAGQSDSGVRYRCQATELLKASRPLRWWDPRQYVLDVLSKNVAAGAMIRAILFRIFRQFVKIGGYGLWVRTYNRIQALRGGTPFPYVAGKCADKTPRETLDLVPGEWVRVKNQEEVLATVNKRSLNHGLSFDPEMVRYCGSRQRVLARVQRIVNERTGEMVNISRDCIILEGVTCRAEYSLGRLFCPRELYPFWREIWLERARAEAETGSVDRDRE